MPNVPQPEDYGLKVFKPGKGDTNSKDRHDMGFTSATATYMEVRSKIVTVNSNPYVVSHGFSYIAKVLVCEILSDHNRKLPYQDASFSRDFSITKDDVKIRGVTSGTFEIIIFGQPIL